MKTDTTTLMPSVLRAPVQEKIASSSLAAAMPFNRQPRFAIVVLIAGLIVASLFSFRFGAVPISTAELIGIAGSAVGIHSDSVSNQHTAVFWMLRLPRVLEGILIGACLGISGAVMQGLFRNPLADPGIMGVSSGAALGAVGMIVLAGFISTSAWFGLWGVPLAAFIGGLIITLGVMRLSTVEGRTSIAVMLLAGIALNALCGAGVGAITFIANDAQLRSITFWSLGSLGLVTWPQIALAAPLILVPLSAMLFQWRVLNAMALGEAEAEHLGFSVERLKNALVIGCAIMVGVAVALAGMIGFIGLVAPHLVRLWIGPDHRWLLPCATLMGSILLVAADLIARVAIIPAELPIGIVTALLGAPFFLWLLRREARRL